jgi:uncharacterized protein YkwD
MTRHLGTLLAALLLATLAPLTLTAPAGATRAEATYAQAAVRETNERRAQHGVRQLAVDDCLERAAARHAARMAAQRRMFHQAMAPLLTRCGLQRVGENVAYGFRTGTAVVHRGWMKSPPHRANLLDRRHRLVAVAARRSGNGVWFASQLFGRR